MKFFVGICALCAAAAGGASAGPSGARQTSAIQADVHHATQSDTIKQLRQEISSLRQPMQVANMKGNPAEIQHEVERMVDRVTELHDSQATVEFATELNHVEAELAAETKDAKLEAEISSTRGSLCAAQGFQAHQFPDCELFMRNACKVDEKSRLQGKQPSTAITQVPQQYCQSFFREGVETSKKSVAAAPAGAPAGAPAAKTGAMGTKSLRPLAEQGFNEYAKGELVQHADLNTMTTDWRMEFGPKSGHRSFVEICADNPGNEWCRLHGFTESEDEAEVAQEEERASGGGILEKIQKVFGGAASSDGGGAHGSNRHHHGRSGAQGRALSCLALTATLVATFAA